MRRQRIGIGVLCVLATLGMNRDNLAETIVEPKSIDLIPPGTVIAQRAPLPWTHLIVKSQPRVTAGDIGQVPTSQVRLAGMYFMATLARVEKIESGEDTSFRLADLASGIGTRIGDRDIIVSPDTIESLGAHVGFIAKAVLGEMQAQQESVEIVLRNDVCEIYDTPIILRRNGRNQSLVFRYAVLVAPQDGNVETLGWLIDVDANRNYRGVASHLQWLAPNLVIDCKLYVDKSEYFLGIPSDDAFASLKIPAGRLQLSLTEESLKTLLCKKRWTQQEATVVEQRLRDALRQAKTATE